MNNVAPTYSIYLQELYSSRWQYVVMRNGVPTIEDIELTAREAVAAAEALITKMRAAATT